MAVRYQIIKETTENQKKIVEVWMQANEHGMRMCLMKNGENSCELELPPGATVTNYMDFCRYVDSPSFRSLFPEIKKLIFYDGNKKYKVTCEN